jgi:hypothetical protein
MSDDKPEVVDKAWELGKAAYNESLTGRGPNELPLALLSEKQQIRWIAIALAVVSRIHELEEGPKPPFKSKYNDPDMRRGRMSPEDFETLRDAEKMFPLGGRVTERTHKKVIMRPTDAPFIHLSIGGASATRNGASLSFYDVDGPLKDKGAVGALELTHEELDALITELSEARRVNKQNAEITRKDK